MRIYRQLIFVALLLWLPVHLFQAQAQEPEQNQLQPQSADSLHYTLYRTWALAPPESENSFKITTFLPQGYLFQVLERDAEEVSGSRYSRVLTQDGVEALIYSGAISSWTFAEALGSQEIIFNTRYALCKVASCNKNNPDTVHQIASGEAFKINLDGRSSLGLMQISATREGEAIRGYLTVSELDEAEFDGRVTRVDRLLPRYSIKKHKSEPLSTDCHETLEKWQELQIPGEDSWTVQILGMLGMGSVDEVVAQLRQSYGTEGYAYGFYLYEAEDFYQEEDSAERFFQIAVGYKTACTESESLATLGFNSELFIEHVLFVSSRNRINNRPMLIEIPSHLFGTPREIREFTGDAYMVSINKPEHFTGALKILTSKLGDRDLAGYFLTELNRSCRSDMRIQYSGSVCRTYDY